MTMPRVRPSALALGFLAGCVAVATAPGQTPNLKQFNLDAKQPSPDAGTRALAMRDAKEKTLGPKAKENQQLLRQLAQFHTFKVTHEQYYTAPDAGELKARDARDTIDLVLTDLDRYVLIPTAESRLDLNQGDYIREFGAAVAEAVVAVLNKVGTARDAAVIRVNAGRVLALAARSGVPDPPGAKADPKPDPKGPPADLAKLTLALLTNRFYGKDGKEVATPPELLYWAAKAAEGLLAAYDPVAFRTGTPTKHALSPRDLFQLVRVLDEWVRVGPPVSDAGVGPAPAAPVGPAQPAPPAPPAVDPKGPAAPPANRLDAGSLSPEQSALVQFYRKQAVRALAKVRVDAVPDPDAGDAPPALRPAFTLAKVAVLDASLTPPPSTAEVGEAVMGLCGLAPSQELNVDELTHVIGVGAGAFFGRKGQEGDKAVPWRVYAARMGAAMAALKRGAATNPRLRQHQQAINALADVVLADAVAPFDKEDAGARPNLDRLAQWVDQSRDRLTQAKGRARSLFTDSPQYRLNPRAVGY